MGVGAELSWLCSNLVTSLGLSPSLPPTTWEAESLHLPSLGQRVSETGQWSLGWLYLSKSMRSRTLGTLGACSLSDRCSNRLYLLPPFPQAVSSLLRFAIGASQADWGLGGGLVLAPGGALLLPGLKCLAPPLPQRQGPPSLQNTKLGARHTEAHQCWKLQWPRPPT